MRQLARLGVIVVTVALPGAMPSVAPAHRRGEDCRPPAIDVLRMADGVVAKILTFLQGQFAALGLAEASC